MNGVNASAGRAFDSFAQLEMHLTEWMHQTGRETSMRKTKTKKTRTPKIHALTSGKPHSRPAEGVVTG